MGKCLFMRKGETHTAPVNYKANFADNTWEQIIDACQKNAVPDTWLVGDQKNMTINGTGYAIDIIGKSHDTYSDGSGTAPLTFQMHNCYGTTYQMNNSGTNEGGWTNCAMRNTHLPSIFLLMPNEVQSGIKEVNKLTSVGSQSSTINTTSDKLFLLSEYEIFGRTSYSVSGEGSQYDYYKAGNPTLKTTSDNLNMWWTRSPDTSSIQTFCRLNNIGGANTGDAGTSVGVSFAFCF